MNFADDSIDDSCPHCGAPLPADARMCRACGVSAEYGWGSATDDEWQEEDDFDYDAFIAREFPEQRSEQPFDPRKMWLGLIILAIVFSLLIGLVR